MENYELETPDGYCGFKVSQKRDEENQKVMMLAAHNCDTFGVSLTILVLKEDWENHVEREFMKHDPTTGLLTSQNELIRCGQANTQYMVCYYFVSPDQKRMGLLFNEDS